MMSLSRQATDLSMKLTRNSIRLALLLTASLLTTKSWGNEANHWIDEDKIKLTIGSFITDYDGTFRITSSKLGLGTEISFEDDLGLEESNTVVRLDGHYRLSAKHRLEFSYFDLSRDGKAVITQLKDQQQHVRPLLVADLEVRGGTLKSARRIVQLLNGTI